MPAFGPVKRRDPIRYLRRLGFTGPHAGTRHEFMARGDVRVRIPNPHHGDIGTDLLTRILREAGVSRQEWEQL